MRVVILLLLLLPLPLSRANAQDPAAFRRPARFRSNADLVLVPVTVTDRHHRTVTGLRADAFRVFEDRVAQLKYSVSEEDAPASVGVILDVSGSMAGSLEQAKEALQAFVQTANPQDEAFLYTVSTRPGMESRFTGDLDTLWGGVLFTAANGSTALIDTIYAGLNQMRAAKNPRKALLIVSDGMDNHSRYSRSELFEAALESYAQVFCISVYDPPGYAKPIQLHEEREGLQLLDDLSELTGGLHFDVRDPKEINRGTSEIGRALRDQYLISFPSASSNPGKWHSIQVKLQTPGLMAHARSGYRSE